MTTTPVLQNCMPPAAPYRKQQIWQTESTSYIKSTVKKIAIISWMPKALADQSAKV